MSTQVDYTLQLPISADTRGEDPAARLLASIFGNNGSTLAEIIEALEAK